MALFLLRSEIINFITQSITASFNLQNFLKIQFESNSEKFVQFHITFTNRDRRGGKRCRRRVKL